MAPSQELSGRWGTKATVGGLGLLREYIVGPGTEQGRKPGAD